MRQLGIKIPENDMEFLDWYSKKYATPKSVVYREITMGAFTRWKRMFLLNLHLDGEIGFKEFCTLADVTMLQAMAMIEEAEREPVVPESLDEYTTDLLVKNLDDKTSLLKHTR